jgi:hypothetical protein
VGELGCFGIGLIGYIKRELCPALTQQELRNILVIHRANGLRGTLIGLKLQVRRLKEAWSEEHRPVTLPSLTLPIRIP